MTVLEQILFLIKMFREVVLIQFDGNLSGRQIKANNIGAGKLLSRDVIAKFIKQITRDETLATVGKVR